jgi:hypothetical protein
MQHRLLIPNETLCHFLVDLSFFSSTILKIWRENDPKRRQIIKTLGVVGSQKGKESFIILF